MVYKKETVLVHEQGDKSQILIFSRDSFSPALFPKFVKLMIYLKMPLCVKEKWSSARNE